MSNHVQNQFAPEARGMAPGRGRLFGRRILVVGGGQISNAFSEDICGNGRAMSILFGREGASVAVADINENSAMETVKKMHQEGSKAFAISGDASVERDMKQMILTASERLGGLDGIVLNVGIAQGRFLENTSVEDWDNVFAVNVRSHFLGCKYGIPAMETGGAIVLISSIAAKTSRTEIPSYSAAKAALSGLCVHAAKEGAIKQIRCNIVVPGLIDTPRGRRAAQLRPSRNQTSIPLGRQGTGWDVAYAASFLLSNEASYITGQTLIVDGGLMIR